MSPVLGLRRPLGGLRFFLGDCAVFSRALELFKTRVSECKRRGQRKLSINAPKTARNKSARIAIWSVLADGLW